MYQVTEDILIDLTDLLFVYFHKPIYPEYAEKNIEVTLRWKSGEEYLVRMSEERSNLLRSYLKELYGTV